MFVILDKSQKNNGYSPATFFANQGITAYIDSMHARAHDKVMIIDKDTVITGSFNFTKAAETQNSENVMNYPAASYGVSEDKYSSDRSKLRGIGPVAINYPFIRISAVISGELA